MNLGCFARGKSRSRSSVPYSGRLDFSLECDFTSPDGKGSNGYRFCRTRTLPAVRTRRLFGQLLHRLQPGPWEPPPVTATTLQGCATWNNVLSTAGLPLSVPRLTAGVAAHQPHCSSTIVDHRLSSAYASAYSGCDASAGRQAEKTSLLPSRDQAPPEHVQSAGMPGNKRGGLPPEESKT